MVRSAKDWPWSSYRATAGLIKTNKWLTVNWILSSFSRKKTDAIKFYRVFVSEGRGQLKPWKKIINQIYLGDEIFVDEMQCKIEPETNLSEVPSSQKRQVAIPLEYYKNKYKDRDTAIFNAYKSGAYSMKAIGDYFELHYSWVSRIIKARNKT
jgi:putative transposase